MIGYGNYVLRHIETKQFVYAGVVGPRGVAKDVIHTPNKLEARTFTYYGQVTEFVKKYHLIIDHWEVLEI